MGDAMEGDQERTARQRKARDQHLSDIDASLNRASNLIEESRNEIQRSRDLMLDRRAENTRQDKADDDRDRED